MTCSVVKFWCAEHRRTFSSVRLILVSFAQFGHSGTSHISPAVSPAQYACSCCSLIIFSRQVQPLLKCIKNKFSRFFSYTVHNVVVQLRVLCKNLIERFLVFCLRWVCLAHLTLRFLTYSIFCLHMDSHLNAVESCTDLSY